MSTVRKMLPSVPRSSAPWSGTVIGVRPWQTSRTWLSRCRAPGNLSDRQSHYFVLARQLPALICAVLYTKFDRFTDVPQSLVAGSPLADASRNNGTLRYEVAVPPGVKATGKSATV